MIASWMLTAVSHFATTFGALLIFLHLWNSPRFAEAWQSPEGKLAYAKHRRLSIVGVGLLAAWLLIQALAIILM